MSCHVHPQGNTAADAARTPQPEAAAAAVVTAVAAPAAAGEPAAAASTSSSSAAGGVSMLTSAEPIDRLRYQAVLIFNHFDTAQAGQLTADQVQQFFAASARKVSLASSRPIRVQHLTCTTNPGAAKHQGIVACPVA